MIGLQEIVAIALLASGLMFLLISAVGMLRLPDFYSRLHTSGNSETFGLMLSLLGLAVYEGFTLTAVKLIMIFVFVFIGNPIGTHILSKAALKTGHPMYLKQSSISEHKETGNNHGASYEHEAHKAAGKYVEEE